MTKPLRDSDPRDIGGYRPQARLGAGGMGQVYLAADESERQLAVKVLKPDLAANPEFRARFAREVNAARAVNGANTATVVDADPLADPPWLACEYIPGPSLQRIVAERGPMPPGQLRKLGHGLASGLSDIHRGGLVHRDLKPGNVIMAADGPRVIDFGIARATDASTLTAVGTVVGTYAYMSPEQITADAATPASDVFALGCVLVFAATGEGPFDATGIPAIVHRVTSEPPRLDGVPDSLRPLIHDCLAKNPRHRPGTDDILVRLTSDAARSPTTAEIRTVPRTEIDPGPAIAKVGVPTRIVPVEDYAEAVFDAEPPRRRLSRRSMIVGGLSALGVAAVAVPAAVLYANSADGPKSDASGDASAGDPGADVVIANPPAMIHDFAFAPDGKTVATSGSNGIQLWNVRTGDRIRTYGEAGSFQVSFARDGKLLGTSTNPIQWWDTRTGDKVATVEGGDPLWMRISPDTEALVTGPGDNTTGEGVNLFAVRDGKRIGSLTKGYTEDAAFSPDGRLVATGGEDGTVLWSATTGDRVRTITKDRCRSVTFTGDGKTLITGGDSVVLWDTATGDKIDTLGEASQGLVLSPDEKTIAHGVGMDAIRLWDVARREVIKTVEVKSAIGIEADNLAFSPDGGTLATGVTGGSGELSVRLWPVKDEGEPKNMTTGYLPVHKLAFSPDGKTLGALAGDGTNDDIYSVNLWHL